MLLRPSDSFQQLWRFGPHGRLSGLVTSKEEALPATEVLLRLQNPGGSRARSLSLLSQEHGRMALN